MENENIVTIDDFKKIELKIARILSAEKIQDADKLLRLEIDLGSEKRQIVSGIAQSYTPEQLIGKQIVVISNLQPRTLKGVESNGMLLAGQDENGISLLIPDRELPDGTGIK